MLGLHRGVAVAALAVLALATVAGALAYRRGRAGPVSAHLLALAQTVLVAQVALGLLLLSEGRRTVDRLHYAYGTFALLAALAPWLYAPADPRRRLLWFTGATLVAGALGVRAYLTSP